MRRELVRAGALVVAAAAATVLALQQARGARSIAVVPVNVSQWTFVGTGQVLPRTAYGLQNAVNSKSLRYEKRDYGINLGWGGSSSSRNISIERQGAQTTPIAFGEQVA